MNKLLILLFLLMCLQEDPEKPTFDYDEDLDGDVKPPVVQKVKQEVDATADSEAQDLIEQYYQLNFEDMVDEIFFKA